MIHHVSPSATRGGGSGARDDGLMGWKDLDAGELPQSKPSSTAEQSRPLRMPTLSMDAISDDHEDDEVDRAEDEW